MTKVARVIGRTRAFALAYRTLMPTLDVRMARSTDGWVSAHVVGLPFLILTTTVAKTGQPRTNPLIYRRDGDDFLVAGTNGGQPKHPGWTANLLAHPEAAIEVGPARLGMRAALVPAEDFDQLFARFVGPLPAPAAMYASGPCPSRRSPRARLMRTRRRTTGSGRTATAN